jgi:hypothetical protein
MVLKMLDSSHLRKLNGEENETAFGRFEQRFFSYKVSVR